MRKLRSFNIDPPILKLFYNSFVENISTFSFICPFYNLNTKQRNSLQRTVNIDSKIVCDQVRTLLFYFLTECICIEYLCYSTLYIALSMFFRVGTSFNLLRFRIRFLINPLLSAWQCGPNIGFGEGWGGGGGGTDAPSRLFMKGIRLSVSPFQRTLNMPCMETSNDCTMDAGSDHWLTKPTEE